LRKQIKVNYTESKNIDSFSTIEKRLFEKAREAAKNTYVPYSEFKIGAALFLQDDKILCGSNQENAAYPTGICAEQIGLAYAHANYPNKKVRTIAITALKSDNYSSSVLWKV